MNLQPPPPPRLPQVPSVKGLFNDDPSKAEVQLENSQRVFDELNCPLEECVKCVVSLLKECLPMVDYSDNNGSEGECDMGILSNQIQEEVCKEIILRN